jgi:hypothetical protein
MMSGMAQLFFLQIDAQTSVQTPYPVALRTELPCFIGRKPNLNAKAQRTQRAQREAL